jgi:hypothetical protein
LCSCELLTAQLFGIGLPSKNGYQHPKASCPRLSRHLLSAQVQLRDLPGFVEARHQLLLLRPQARANWINFAVAHHLNGNHELAAQVRKP